MTTEAPISKIAEIEARLTTARENVAKAQAEAAEKTTAFIALPEPKDYAVLTEIGKPAAQAAAILASIEAELKTARDADSWEKSITIREPVLNGIREMLIDNTPVISLATVTGRLQIVPVETDGKVTGHEAKISLTPVVSKPDLTEIEASLQETVDVEAFMTAGFRDVVINVTGIDGEKPTISLMPASAATQVAKAASKPRATTASTSTTEKTRSAPIQWLYAGDWLTSREMLEAVKASTNSDETQVVSEQPVAFENALKPGGNGMSNLAKRVGEKLGLESREKPADE